MSDNKVFLITGASRGLGVDLARAALDAGHSVVATGRSTDTVSAAVGTHDELLVAALDVTDPASVQAAVDAAVARFGRIDVLVNNAGSFQAGFFEQISPEQFHAQMVTNFYGPMDVTRRVLPLLRAQRSGVVVTVTSTAGIVGGAFTSAYAASKFALEGWMESLAPEVAPFGISTLTVEPGFFRTELLTPESTTVPDSTIPDYAAGTEATVAAFAEMNGQQAGDPAKLATALVELAASEQPPARFVAGADAMTAIEGRIATLQAEIDAHRELSSSLCHDS